MRLALGNTKMGLHWGRSFARAKARVARLTFVHPSDSVVIAASCLTKQLSRVEFLDDSERYAKSIGLLDAVNGERPRPKLGALSGKSYSPLCRIDDQADVDSANHLVSSTLESHLVGNPRLLSVVRQVVGEIHDNVWSHARGVGFSACQIYGTTEADRLVQFAVADCGAGFLRNARRVLSSLSDDFEAIEWCLEKNNTSAGMPHEFAQRIDPDDPFGGLPPGVPTRTSSNHHQGLGLYKLRKCVEAANGSMVLVSGSGGLVLKRDGTTIRITPPIPWRGVFIEFELPSSAVLPSDQENPKLQELAEYLGWNE